MQKLAPCYGTKMLLSTFSADVIWLAYNSAKYAANFVILSLLKPSYQQEALLWQRDCATRLSVEILQLQNIPIVCNYLRDPTFSRFYTIPECDRHTHRDGQTDTRRRHVLR